MWTTVAILAGRRPGQRLALMCRKSQPQMLLVSTKYVAIAQDLGIPALMTVPGDQESNDVLSPTNLQTKTARSHNILYTRFTSGSTGQRLRDESYGFL